jgi:hypothetical protein
MELPVSVLPGGPTGRDASSVAERHCRFPGGRFLGVAECVAGYPDPD